tara:strand:+ start:61216 stop:62379 length:1164 start_codon:yes stop_codon:yes gene_type:complete
MNIKKIIKESLVKVLGEAKKDLFPKNRIVSINSIKKYLKGIKPGITIHLNKKISYTKVEDNVFTSDKYTDLGLDQLANVMDQAFRKKQKVQVEEHVVTFTKDEMSKLHKDGKITKKDEEGKDHDYVYNEEFELEKEKMTDPDDMRMYNEASLRKVFNATKKGNFPVTLVAIENGKVVDQKLVGTREIVPAAFNEMQREFPKAQVNVEDRTGKILFRESINEAVEPQIQKVAELTGVAIDKVEKYVGSRTLNITALLKYIKDEKQVAIRDFEKAVKGDKKQDAYFIKMFNESIVTEAIKSYNEKDTLYKQLHDKYAESIKGLKAGKIKKSTDLVSVQRWAMEDAHDTPGHDHKKMSATFKEERKLFKQWMAGDKAVRLKESVVTEGKT